MELVDLAKEAFKRSNFELATDLFDRLLRQSGQNVDFLLMKGASLANMGRLNQALNTYSHAFRLGDISSDQLLGFVDALVKYLSQSERRDNKTLGLFSCPACRGLLSKPTTLICGHTFCQSCLDHQSKRSCIVCLFPYSAHGGKCKKMHLNVTVGELILKYFPNEVKAQEVKAEGNQLFKQGKRQEAVERYTEAISMAPGDHLCLSNRVHALITEGNFVDALKDATKVCQMRPDWAKGFYRKGSALLGLNRHMEAMHALLSCLTLDPSIHSAKMSLTKVLHVLLQPIDTCSVKVNELKHILPQHDLTLDPMDTSRMVNVALDQWIGIGAGDQQSDGEDVEEEEDEMMIDGSTKVSRTTSKILDRRKFCQVEQRYTKKRLPSQSDEYLQSALHLSEDQTPTLGSLGNSKRFKKNPLSPIKAESLEKEVFNPGPGYKVPVDMIKKEDYECSLCLRLLHQPTTTPCGHTFCRGCLDRCLDYSQACPLCKQSLTEYQANQKKSVTMLLQELMEMYLPSELKERQVIHRKELEQVASHAYQDGGEIPVFVCTIAFPTIPCPLHVFEPRYRLMVRQVIESGARQFGMCASDEDNEFSEYGCMLEINQHEYLPDGRCILGTVGGRRFRVLERGMRNGYNTAKVEFIRDSIAEGESARELRELNDSVYQQARTWFVNLPIYHQTRIVDHFGPMPQQVSDAQATSSGPQWHWWLLAILPLHPRVQQSILAKTSLKERLQVLQRSLTRMTNLPS